MNSSKTEMLETTAKIQMDLKAAQAKLVAVRAHISQLEIPDKPAIPCATCGLRFRSANRLAEHVYHVHDGPEPEHWKAAELKGAHE